MPEWYAVLRASDRLRCSPMELLGQNAFWYHAALMAERAEAKAEAWHMKHPKR